MPVGLLAAAILEVIPIFAYRFAATVELKFTLLTLIIGIIIVSFIFLLLSLWWVGVFLTPTLSCRVIAPVPKVATVIYATIFVLFQVPTLVGMFRDGTGWAIILFKMLFSVLLLGGVVVAYREPEEKVTHAV